MKAWTLFAVLGLAIAGHAVADDVGGAGETPVPGGIWIVDALPPSPSVEARLLKIRERIASAVVYPNRSRQRGHQGQSTVAFEIDTQGTPIDIEVTRSSGYRRLDRAAREAVRDAAPLPWVFGRVELPVQFSLETVRRR